MAKAGDVIENPITGERITFLKTTRETNGDLLRFEYVVPPRFYIPEHVHPCQEERHDVLSGTLRGRLGGQERLLRRPKGGRPGGRAPRLEEPQQRRGVAPRK